MSGMEISNLIQTGELAKDEVADKLVKEAEAHAEEQIETIKEQKSKRKKALIKFGSMAVLAAVVVVFATIAWFSMNRTVETSGMSIRANAGSFEITPLGSESGRYDSFLDDAKRLAGVDGSITWTVNSTDNVGNAVIDGQPVKEQGIMPGSEGVISFVVTPTETVNLSFEFKTHCYEYDEENNVDFALLSSNSDNQSVIDALNLINGHILLFRDRTGTPENYKYSGLIKNSNDLNRVYSDHASFSSQETVHIYWVWPETLAQVVLDDNNSNLYGKKSICVGDDKTVLINYLKSNPECFLKGAADFSSMTVNQIKSEIDDNYDSYSTMYNEADQIIGTTVQFLLISMDVSGG